MLFQYRRNSFGSCVLSKPHVMGFTLLTQERGVCKLVPFNRDIRHQYSFVAPRGGYVKLDISSRSYMKRLRIQTFDVYSYIQQIYPTCKFFSQGGRVLHHYRPVERMQSLKNDNAGKWMRPPEVKFSRNSSTGDRRRYLLYQVLLWMDEQKIKPRSHSKCTETALCA